MSTSQWTITIVEALVVGALIIGLFCEPMLAKWEQKQKEKVLKALKKRKEYRK